MIGWHLVSLANPNEARVVNRTLAISSSDWQKDAQELIYSLKIKKPPVFLVWDPQIEIEVIAPNGYEIVRSWPKQPKATVTGEYQRPSLSSSQQGPQIVLWTFYKFNEEQEWSLFVELKKSDANVKGPPQISSRIMF